MKTGTVALIVGHRPGEPPTGDPVLVEALSDDREIEALERAVRAGNEAPLVTVYELRSRQSREDEEFGDYVEELLSQPFVRPEIQEHGVQWLKSKIRIEQFQRSETEAMRVIADYAFKLFLQDRNKTDFLLASAAAQVRIRVFWLKAEEPAQSNAA
jgi:hypothetical protein